MNNSIVLSGNIQFLKLGELLQLLGANGSTGILRIISNYSEIPGLIYILKGNPVNATAGELTGLDAVYSLFGWVDGRFEFSNETFDAKHNIKKSRMEIILEGIRLLDNGVTDRIGPVTFVKDKSKTTGIETTIPVIKGPLIDYTYVVDEEDYHDNETIVMQGKHGAWVWIILGGTVEIRKESSKGQVSICRIGTGSFIGSMASFIIQGSVRNTTAVAISDVQLGVLDLQRLSREYAHLSSGFQEIVISLDNRLNQGAIRIVDIESKKTIPNDFMAGKEPFIKQGSSRSEIYKIEQGKADIVRSENNNSILLGRLEEGDFIGNIPFLNIGHEPDSASVYGSEDFDTVEISIEELQSEYNRLSPTLKNMIANNANLISATTTMACELFGVAKRKKTIKNK